MDVHDTKLITDVQYLAPLMAYFNTKLHVKSKVLTLDDGKYFIDGMENNLHWFKTESGVLEKAWKFANNRKLNKFSRMRHGKSMGNIDIPVLAVCRMFAP